MLRQEHYSNDNSDESEGFDKLLDGLGTPPLFTVVRVNTLKTTVHDAQQQLQKILEEVCCKENIWRNESYRNPGLGEGGRYSTKLYKWRQCLDFPPLTSCVTL